MTTIMICKHEEGDREVSVSLKDGMIRLTVLDRSLPVEQRVFTEARLDVNEVNNLVEILNHYASRMEKPNEDHNHPWREL